MDQQTEISGHLEGIFHGDRLGPFSGPFSAKVDAGRIMFCSESLHQPIYVPSIRLISEKNSLFSLSNVIIGNQFHWERKENQTFQGDLILHLREDGTISAINEISLEDYLESVISSEMSGEAHIEFLKAHAILSRSWLLAGLSRKKKIVGSPPQSEKAEEGEIIRWYDREDHDLYDVCADDHCQRYQGISKSAADNAQEAVRETHGRVLIFQDEICDARYSKCCGGLTENFNTAWADIQIPYLTTVSDAPISHQSIRTEEEATRWVLSPLEAYCRVMDEHLLERILSGFDQETKNFFRWKVEYPRKELEEILRQKSGFDFGTLIEILPLRRGPSGRISRLKIIGSKRSLIIGKELEIRRWLSRTHLYSSAFIVVADAKKFIFHGAGWGHGVGLCQIGAAAMATQGFSAEEILKHYFKGVEIKKIY
ncbi:MAG: SpoIID/LytB domain-containing protein [Deltaproteobacteria bacterium]|nr:SpoIID/LytB domain-containing protein [Deltaproteobacteria bacterium]